MYKVTKKHVRSFNCNGKFGTCGGSGGVWIAREVFNQNSPVWHSLVFLHEIQHCDVDSCISQGAACFAQAVYGKQMKLHPTVINWWKHVAKSMGYTQDMWDYHHSEEFAKNRIPYEEIINKNGGAFNVSK